ncbi:hypothetical protein BGP75_17355 [Motiliproteus sp. MSK22-1]|nr:hypothetical protein BGP75_17355 [Motiliproteus sp. MSK22-1]
MVKREHNGSSKLDQIKSYMQKTDLPISPQVKTLTRKLAAKSATVALIGITENARDSRDLLIGSQTNSGFICDQ